MRLLGSLLGVGVSYRGRAEPKAAIKFYPSVDKAPTEPHPSVTPLHTARPSPPQTTVTCNRDKVISSALMKGRLYHSTLPDYVRQEGREERREGDITATYSPVFTLP